jgi:hypothetical protein
MRVSRTMHPATQLAKSLGGKINWLRVDKAARSLSGDAIVL